MNYKEGGPVIIAIAGLRDQYRLFLSNYGVIRKLLIVIAHKRLGRSRYCSNYGR